MRPHKMDDISDVADPWDSCRSRSLPQSNKMAEHGRDRKSRSGDIMKECKVE